MKKIEDLDGVEVHGGDQREARIEVKNLESRCVILRAEDSSPWKCDVLNISRSGFGVWTPLGLDIGDLAILKFKERNFVLPVKVCWASKSEIGYRLGLKQVSAQTEVYQKLSAELVNYVLYYA